VLPDSISISSFVLAQEIQKIEQKIHLSFPILITFVKYIVDLTAANLFFAESMPTCSCLELSCAALSLDKRMLTAELQNSENASSLTVLMLPAHWIITASSTRAKSSWMSVDVSLLLELARPRWKPVHDVPLLELARPR
jgi:hypothetical protein